jgi:hypothetical protein
MSQSILSNTSLIKLIWLSLLYFRFTMHQQKITISKMNVSKLIRKYLISMHQQKVTILKMNGIKLLISQQTDLISNLQCVIKY